jgi:hypothetical protein
MMKKSQKLPLPAKSLQLVAQLLAAKQNVVFPMFCDCLLFVGSPGGGVHGMGETMEQCKVSFGPTLGRMFSR